MRWQTDELYSKQHPRNRCRIATSHGAQELAVPLVHGRNQRVPLSRVRPLYNGKWQREHAHALRTAYGRAPFFLFYADSLFDVIHAEHDSLADLNMSLIGTMLKHFDIRVTEANDSMDTKAFEENALAHVAYRQVFSDKTGFVAGCSALDLLFNHGPDSRSIMAKATNA